MGRPKLKANQGRVPFQVRMNPAEAKELEEAAKTAGLPTSTWMRMVCLEAARKLAKKVAA